MQSACGLRRLVLQPDGETETSPRLHGAICLDSLSGPFTYRPFTRRRVCSIRSASFDSVTHFPAPGGRGLFRPVLSDGRHVWRISALPAGEAGKALDGFRDNDYWQASEKPFPAQVYFNMFLLRLFRQRPPPTAFLIGTLVCSCPIRALCAAVCGFLVLSCN